MTVRVAEGSGRPVERRLTAEVVPAAAMIGVKPLFDGVVGEGTEARFQLIGVGTDLAPAPMAVKWQLNRIETDYQWYQSLWQLELGAGDLSQPPLPKARRCWARSRSMCSARSTGANMNWWSNARMAALPSPRPPSRRAGMRLPMPSATPDTLELSLDKPAYKSGETATLRVVPRAAGTALVTVLSNRLVSMQAVEVTEGENLITAASDR